MEELDLKELFSIFWNKRLHIAIIVSIFIIIGIIYSYVFVSPKYKSVTSLLLAKSYSTENPSESITQTDININSKLVADYSELIKSKSLVREVIENLKLNVSEASIQKSVTVAAKNNTQFIEITVTNSNPETAQIIANEIAKVFTKRVEEIYSINNVHVIDEAEVNNNPYNINHIKDIIIFAFIGFLIASGYVLVANMLDTTIKSVQDIEKATGLTVLAAIPEYSVESKGGKK